MSQEEQDSELPADAHFNVVTPQTHLRAPADSDGTMRATLGRLRPALLPEFQAAVLRARDRGERDVGNAARLEMLERFGPDAYEKIPLGVVSGGAWHQRVQGNVAVHRANALIAPQFTRALEAGE